MSDFSIDVKLSDVFHNAERLPTGGVIGALKSFYYDIAMSANPFVFPSLTTLVGAERLLFGTDYPYVPAAGVPATIAGLRGCDRLDESQRAAVERGNALRLFPRLRRNTEEP